MRTHSAAFVAVCAAPEPTELCLKRAYTSQSFSLAEPREVPFESGGVLFSVFIRWMSFFISHSTQHPVCVEYSCSVCLHIYYSCRILHSCTGRVRPALSLEHDCVRHLHVVVGVLCQRCGCMHCVRKRDVPRRRRRQDRQGNDWCANARRVL